MRHFRIFHSSFGLMLAGVAACAVLSCTDDTFDKYGQQGASGMLAFDVVAPGSWADGSAATRAADKDISIREITQSGGGKPLYLVTEIAEAAVDTAASNAITRGSTITEGTFKKQAFGLSGICYTGDWPEGEEGNEWTTNFAHNIRVSYEGNKWNSEKTLQWVASENIKFFAYSPYSAAVPASSGASEEEAADPTNSTPSIIHSAEEATGVPTLTYTVPQDVTKQIDLMYATADCDGSGVGGDALQGVVQLNFKHALTAVTIKAGKKMLPGTVSKIEISGVYGSGIYPIGADKWTATGKADRTFSIENEIKNESGTVLNPDDKGYTFMMIPQTLTENAKLTISFKDDLTKIDRTLTAKLKDFTKDDQWEVGKQYTYSINSTGIVVEPVIEMTVNRENMLYPNGGYWGTDKPNPAELYTKMSGDDKLEYLPVSGVLNDVSIAAYMKVVQASAEESDPAKNQIRKLDFKIEYSIDGGFSWKSEKEFGWRPTTVPQSTADNTDLTAPVSGSIVLPAQPKFTDMRNFLYGKGTTIEGVTLPKTISKEGKGSKDTPHDLVANNEVKESANCYIVNDHGYYTFPTYYGNTYGKNGTSSYKYDENLEKIPDNVSSFVLTKFVGHDDNPISDGKISGVSDAILLWQDSPDLVTEVKYENDQVSFRVPEETINQGNAVIAVRNSSGVILWSWHIWVTHRKWDSSTCIQLSDKNLNEKNKPFIIAPCNLGYCEPHEEDAERNILIRFVVDSKQVGDSEVKLTVNGAPQPRTAETNKGIITFTQPKIAASAAGDNTYYQWGRKDPMLPGIHNGDTYSSDTELDMVNKMFYSTYDYRFTSGESARSIGESIRYPYQFFMHQRPQKDGDNGGVDNYKRRHWHDGQQIKTSYNLKTIMNYWNTQLTQSGTSSFNYKIESPDYSEFPNNKYVIKTIYDPSPAGFKIPPIKAFADFFDSVELSPKEGSDTTVGKPNTTESSKFQGWEVSINSKPFYFPATGVRDMGVKDHKVDYGTFPAFSSITYIATSGFHSSDGASSSCLIFSIDKRAGNFSSCTTPIHGTNNAYGFTVRPIRDGQQ